jgi:hypothetical protein
VADVVHQDPAHAAAEAEAEDCSGAAVLELASGRVAYPAALNPLPPPAACGERDALEYRADSRLLTLTGRAGDSLVTRYLVWNPDTLSFRTVAVLAAGRPARCAPRL